MENRIRELKVRYDDYGEESPLTALQSTEAPCEKIVRMAGRHPLRTPVFQASVFDAAALKSHVKATRVSVERFQIGKRQVVLLKPNHESLSAWPQASMPDMTLRE